MSVPQGIITNKLHQVLINHTSTGSLFILIIYIYLFGVAVVDGTGHPQLLISMYLSVYIYYII